MNNRARLRLGIVCAAWIGSGGTLAMTAATGAETPEWPGWGGPQRDFVCRLAKDLAIDWPKDGPPKLWSREIGDGYSSIIVEGDRLYTMCRRENQDAVLALDARTGKTIWETRYDAPIAPGQNTQFGPGPHATPLLVGDRLFTIGATVKLHCLDKKTGRILWSHDLMKEMAASHLMFGYGASPTPYRDLVIVTVPGGNKPVVAFKQETGDVAWKSENLRLLGESSPVFMKVGGKTHLAVMAGVAIVGLDPETGKTLWKAPIEGKAGQTMSTPNAGADGIIFATSAYGGGCWGVKVDAKPDGGYDARQIFHNLYLKVHHESVVRVGDFVYGSSGDFGPAILVAMNVKTGNVAWRERGFAKANLIYADGKMIVLDEDGDLAIATATPESLTVHSRANILTHQAWTVPTLIGSTLYLRDRKTIMALDLGKQAAAKAGGASTDRGAR